MRKSILYIFVVIMALSLTLCAVSAEDVADETPVAQNAAGEDSTDVSSSIEEVSVGWGYGNRYDFYRTGTGKHDYCVVISALFEYNYAEVEAGDSFELCSMSDYESSVYTWHADFSYGDTRVLSIFGRPYSDVTMEISVYEESSNVMMDGLVNDGSAEEIDTTKEASPIKEVNLTKEINPVEKVSAAEKTLPATGNPLAMALLSLIAIGIGGIRRKF